MSPKASSVTDGSSASSVSVDFLGRAGWSMVSIDVMGMYWCLSGRGLDEDDENMGVARKKQRAIDMCVESGL